MSEKSKSVTVSTWGDYLIGYERVLDYLKEAQKESPKVVALKKDTKAKGSYITLQFKLGDKPFNKSCGCNLTMQGVSDALKKAHLVATALESLSSETEFWSWYDDVILGKNVVRNDLITFGEAIAKVEAGYWDGYTKKRQKRDKENASHLSIWYDAYGQYYKLLPQDTIVNLTDVMSVINSKKTGSKTRQTCLSVMKKLAETIGDSRLREELSNIDGKQTIYRDDLQAVSIEDFLQLRNDVLNIPANDKRYHLESRKAWLWVFSMQIVYGLRVHEVFAIQNVNQPFKTKDGATIPALSDPINTKMIAVVGDKTALNTTTKTGYRLTIPLLPPTHANLIEQLEIKSAKLPELNLVSTNPNTIVGKYNKSARDRLESWSKFTQTHALRHLSNLNGMMSGISLETRAMSLGHSPTMNDTVYKRRQTTQTTIDLLTKSDNQAIPLNSAIKVLKQLGADAKMIAYTASIYSVSPDKITELLTDI
ncbi:MULTISPECIES: hypothetical protein [unclassified Microcoleus]|uniref:hypothetical protein n=1 Tax=unclassified Microcoleus TaxID=2642155 RepID=UPI001D457267|nr:MULTISPECIES: hypothetical protein [unclassified Microcoleus]MCC3443728.1 hypothetical protein [Microcoleus sp. PH2017_03_ELD_O_A]MCC3505702.1 hypothetical protein [Microcoleus sp. PH2017_19_SFW_U_A]TAG90584.1 MAG: hypothetical protein EAZ19_22295 [Oscillatoriales cyanobacterium]MCC3500503.1 hypothetical protein [Microcoleus sp. PH2017_15_JOR_U_A]MCC3525724.1 hypothetical protein [Microcoleus sp. PH2017_20_SFW_D_A]